MIQFNLLPDVKLQYLKTTRIKRTVMVIAGLAGSVALVVFLTLFVSVRVLQKNHLGNLDKDVKQSISDLRAIPDINKVLTVQNQLNRLPALHDQKPIASRLFTYLAQVTPDLATISDFEIDFSESKTITIEGNADTLNTVNKFVDTLKFTEYSVTHEKDEPKGTCGFKEVSYDEEKRTQFCTAFSDVVLADFELQETSGKYVATYEINLKFDPNIFDAKLTPTLQVPMNYITTRSEIEKPLFKENPNPIEETEDE